MSTPLSLTRDNFPHLDVTHTVGNTTMTAGAWLADAESRVNTLRASLTRASAEQVATAVDSLAAAQLRVELWEQVALSPDATDLPPTYTGVRTAVRRALQAMSADIRSSVAGHRDVSAGRRETAREFVRAFRAHDAITSLSPTTLLEWL